MTDIFSIFTEVDEEKIGIAVEPILGKIVAFFVDNCSSHAVEQSAIFGDYSQ
jgi:hypothetical protein